MKSNRPKQPSTQKYLNIAEIKEDVVIMKDGSMRAVLLASSINFGLKGDDEQKGIIAGYIGFLNSLDFPFQIVIQSRRMNIDNYLKEVDDHARNQTNELLKIQTKEYRQFVSQLVTLGDIMSKRFYVVVPYSDVEDSKRGFLKRFKSVLSPANVVSLQQKRFRELKAELMKRVDHISNGLVSFGIGTAMLDTQSLIELYYSSYNPDISDIERMKDLDDLKVEQT